MSDDPSTADDAPAADGPDGTDGADRAADVIGSPALAGAAAALATLALGWLFAAFAEQPWPVDNVATAVIHHSPRWLVDFGIENFGTNDKLALGIGIVVITVLVGAGLGRVTVTRRWPAVVAYTGFAAVGLVAAADRPDAGVGSAAVVLVLAAGTGLVLHLALVRLSQVPAPAPMAPVAARSTAWPTRRTFLGAVGAVAAGAVLAGTWARVVANRVAEAARDAVGLPTPRRPAPPVPAEASFDVPGLSPLVTPNRDFYRIDTSFSVPRIAPDDWELTVHGLVDEPFTLTYERLLAEPMVERHLTLSCVSNEVGGDLVGNALWLGTPLADLVRRARPQSSAEQVVGRSVDGFTVGFPLDALFDGRDALVAVGMNGEPLPFAHGFPARLVVEGLYGYVSATKWLTEIELTTWDGFDAYWIPRGWAKEAPVKTQSRIDVPRDRDVAAGPVVVAGVAWAPDRGISRVEVRVDDGDWQEADLASALSDATWRQWRTEVTLDPGDHTLSVRATDGAGEVQTGAVAPPPPDGATGHHTVRLEAT